jgi:hypothetical protein
MNTPLLRSHICSVHRHIHRLRQSPVSGGFQTEMLRLCEEMLVDLNFARTELKRIEALRLAEPLGNPQKEAP